ncbi:MAG: methyltransferase domain-containing protein [Deltaproteobacteria bacterium]|nr:methyltransferase domain-containing protein [Deltaproteobacteria bacterium]NIS76143.1 methyltransferase domain-containing protein [Deltaproteobacteria bacterium]
MKLAEKMAESGVLPDSLVRAGIRMMNRERLKMEGRGTIEDKRGRFKELIEKMDGSAVAPRPEMPNLQHYEVPADFFKIVLGKHLKYSCCYYPTGGETLDEAEEAMLRVTCERALIGEGMDILELGCGWGALTLWMAEMYPSSRVTALSNSASQREFIEGRCRELGIGNVRVVTADMNDFQTGETFDRVVSVEMFEHMRNYRELMRRISTWMRPGAYLFVHLFCHRLHAYTFEGEGDDNWMGNHFFTGGIMPSDGLLLNFQEHLALEEHWRMWGEHYRRTAEDWLANLDGGKDAIMPVLEATYGKGEASRWFHRWRIFFIACAELWGFRGGREWLVSHYRFRKGS